MPMCEAARARIRSLRLHDRVCVQKIDMSDLSSVADASFDLVTVCLGLHLLTESHLLHALQGIARVLTPGGRLVASLWDDAPLMGICSNAVEAVTAAAVPVPTHQFRIANGRIDSLWAGAGLVPAPAHNTVMAISTNLGLVDGEKAWRQGPPAVLPKLMVAMGNDEPFVAALREAFSAQCHAAGLVDPNGDLQVVQQYRILDVVRPVAKATAASAPAVVSAPAASTPAVSAHIGDGPPSLVEWKRSPALGSYLVARERLRDGDVVSSESPLLAAPSTEHGTNEPGWATHMLRTFCDAPPETRAAVLGMFAGDSSYGAVNAEVAVAHARLTAQATEEVARCAPLEWRRARRAVSDASLQRACRVFALNQYDYTRAGGDGRACGALFTLGCAMNHSCAPNVRYSSSLVPGRATFLAAGDIAAGEELTTNYLGEYGAFMSTPARRAALRASKLFECQCARCCSADDPARAVPCPGCHTRNSGEQQLATDVALGTVAVHYAVPLSSEAGARWACAHCGRSWAEETVLPGPDSQGRLAGRAWEAVVEQHVLSLDRQWIEAGRGKQAAAAAALADASEGLHTLVAHSLGSRHWTTQRLREIRHTISSLTTSS